MNKANKPLFCNDLVSNDDLKRLLKEPKFKASESKVSLFLTCLYISLCVNKGNKIGITLQ